MTNFLDLYKKELKQNLLIDSEETLQYRHLIKGKYKGTNIFGKLFHYNDKLTQPIGSFDEESDKEWAYDSLKNSILFHSLLQDIEKKLEIDLGIAELIKFEITNESIYQIIELIEGRALKYNELSTKDITEIVDLLIKWRHPKINEVLNKKIHKRWYFDSYEKATKWLKSSFIEGNFSSGISNFKNEPLIHFLEKRQLDVIVKTYKHFICSNKIENLINNYQGIKTVQHSDIIAGWVERVDKTKNYEGNLMKDKNNNLYIIDFDFGTISENIFISLFADIIKLDFYLFDQLDKSKILKDEAFKIFNKHYKDIDLDLSWNMYTFLHGVLWELPFWVEVYNSTENKNKIAENCFDWLIQKITKSSEEILKI